MTTRQVALRQRTPRPAAVRELRGLLVECRDALAQARLSGWKPKQVLDYADRVLREMKLARPEHIGALRIALMECELVMRLWLAPEHCAQQLAASIADVVVRTYSLARTPPGPPRAPRPNALPQTY